jgi:uncharacterized protein YjiS (DUF1127 family)
MQALPNIPRPGTRRPFDYRFEAALRGAAWAWCLGRIASAVARFKARQTVRELALLSDGQLRDVGLLRADIERVAAVSASSRTRATDAIQRSMAS